MLCSRLIIKSSDCYPHVVSWVKPMKLNTNLSTLHKKTNLQDKYTENFGAAQKFGPL